MIERALREHVLSKSQITTLIGSRCWFGDLPATKGQLPDVAFRILSGDHDATSTGDADDLQFPVFEFNCRALLPTECITLAGLVRRALQELRLGATIAVPGLGNVIVEQLEIEGKDDTRPEKLQDGSDKLMYTRVVTASVGYRYDTSPVT